MIQNTTYQNAIAVVLLSLYAFIAMPIQVWHKHAAKQTYYPQLNANIATAGADNNVGSFGKVYSTSAAKPTQVAVIDEVRSAGDNAENCKICSHHYSSYMEGTGSTLLIKRLLSKVLYSSFQSSFAREEVLSFSNKGPPANI